MEKILPGQRNWQIPAGREIPDWLKLDNTAIIFPFTMSKNYASMFRISVTLRDEINPIILEDALKITLKRIPSFGCKLKHGLFWHYFDRADNIPPIREEVRNPLTNMDWKDNRDFLFRVRYYRCRISLEVFHALADGTGALIFLLTLATAYLQLACGYSYEPSPWVLDPFAWPQKSEYENAYLRCPVTKGHLKAGEQAYHLDGTLENRRLLSIIIGRIPVDKIKEAAAKYDCTVTAFLTSVMLHALQEAQEAACPSMKKLRPTVVTLPVNLRRFYHSNTLRNFFACVDVGIDPKLGHYSFEEIVSCVKHSMALKITKKELNSIITVHTNLAKNRFLRGIPLLLKRPFLLLGSRIFGDRSSSTTLSNLGNFALPPNLSEHITAIDCTNGRHQRKTSTCVCVSYGGVLSISFARKIKEPELERRFFTTLIKMGIPVRIESNQDTEGKP